MKLDLIFFTNLLFFMYTKIDMIFLYKSQFFFLIHKIDMNFSKKEDTFIREIYLS